MTKITLVTTRYTKKQGTKNGWKLVDTETEEVTEQQHKNATNDDACKWFRRLGGSETKQMGYTCAGYKCTKLISTSPDKEDKTIREYTFQWIEAKNN
jgi:hypothetical protein